jgi:hypothetical protein
MKKPKTALSFTGGKRPDPASDTPGCNGNVVALRVRTCYAQERTRWETMKAGTRVDYVVPKSFDGRPAVTVEGECVLEKAKAPVWVTLANWFREQKIHPETYIRLTFDRLTHEPERAPEPIQLKSAKYLDQWNKHKDGIAKHIGVALVVERQQAEIAYGGLRAGGVEPETAWAHVLTSDGLELSALFRYCLAVRLGGKRFDRVAAYFEPAAILQFERYRKIYKVQWAGLLPKGFAARSRRIYPHLLGP